MNKGSARDPGEKNAFKLFVIVCSVLAVIAIVGAFSTFFGHSDVAGVFDDLFDSNSDIVYVKSIKINENTIDRVLFVNETLDLSNLKATVKYSNGNIKTFSLNDSRLFVSKNIDTSTSGIKELVIGCGNVFDTVLVYVAEADGLGTSIVDKTSSLYYTEMGSVTVYAASQNIIPFPFVNSFKEDLDNGWKFSANDDGSITVVTKGGRTESLGMLLYNGKPIVRGSIGSKIRVSLGGNCSPDVFLKFNLFKDENKKSKVKQYAIHCNHSMDIDLSEYADIAGWWEISLVANGDEHADTFEEGTVNLQIEFIDEITHMGGEYATESFNYTVPSSFKVNMEPDSNGLLDLSEFIAQNSDKKIFIYSESPSRDIYLIK